MESTYGHNVSKDLTLEEALVVVETLKRKSYENLAEAVENEGQESEGDTGVCFGEGREDTGVCFGRGEKIQVCVFWEGREDTGVCFLGGERGYRCVFFWEGREDTGV